MNNSTPDLIKVTELFLIPSSFLVAALGTADTNIHRATVSLLGFIISILWWVCTREALAELGPRQQDGRVHPRRVRALSWLAIVFLLGWLISLIGHLLLWNRPLGVGA